MGLFDWQDETEEERESRIFHLHDDPKDCDEPEIHFGPISKMTGDEAQEYGKQQGWW